MKQPVISTIELTNACNFSCPYCQRNFQDGQRPVGFVGLQLIDKLISENAFENTRYIELQQNGEPTLHKQFGEIVDRLSGAVAYIGMSTNATFARRDNFNEIIEAVKKLHHITISIHAETTAADIVAISEALANSKTRIRVQTVGGEWHNVNKSEIERDNIFFDNYPLRTFGKEYGEKRFCADLGTSVTIQWDGDVVPCCNCVGKQKVLGNCYKQTIEEIWNIAGVKGWFFDYCKTCESASPYARRLVFFDDVMNKI